MTYDSNDITIPDDAGEYGPGLHKVLSRFPRGYWKSIDCDKGWYQIIVELDDRLARFCPTYQIYEIKQSSGTLRYRWGSESRLEPETFQKMRDITDSYEMLSRHTCELTGTSGVLMMKDYNLRTLNPAEAPEGYEIYDRSEM